MAERRPPSHDELLRRLEASAPLLEATRTRYRALLPALLAWGWRQRLRAVADIAGEVARSDEVVERALSRALRRAEAEAWPEGATRELLDEVSTLRTRLGLLISRRLEREEKPGPGLSALLGELIGVPRKVTMGEREPAAQEALRVDPTLIPQLQRFGASLEKLFSRPLTRGERLPFTLEELEVLIESWPEGTRALARGWEQVARIDTTGGVQRELARRAKRAPRGNRGLPGPRALVHAAFWSAAADAHLQALLGERFAPVQLVETERISALRFLLAREVDGTARLGGGPRAALLMLAHELTAAPVGRAPLSGGRSQVRAWAAEADALQGHDDWRRVRDGLSALSARTFRSALPPIYRVGKRVERAVLPERLQDFFSAAQ